MFGLGADLGHPQPQQQEQQRGANPALAGAISPKGDDGTEEEVGR